MEASLLGTKSLRKKRDPRSPRSKLQAPSSVRHVAYVAIAGNSWDTNLCDFAGFVHFWRSQLSLRLSAPTATFGAATRSHVLSALVSWTEVC